MKQSPRSRGLGKNTTMQLAVLAAVAVIGISFGRWGVPASASDDSPAFDTRNVSVSAAAAINERKYESGRLDSILFGDDRTGSAQAASVAGSSQPHAVSPAATINERRYESGRLDNILFLEDSAASASSSTAPQQTSAAEVIVLRKYESGRLYEILFGAD